VDAALWSCWAGTSGFAVSDEERSVILKAGNGGEEDTAEAGKNPATYGEVTETGARQIARVLGLDELGCPPKFVFVDLGSGVGKLVTQAYLEWPAVKRSIGVELSQERSARAVEAWRQCSTEGFAKALRGQASMLGRTHGDSNQALLQESVSEPEFWQVDFFQADLTEATHVYIASLCFSDALLERLSGKLATEAPNLQAVASLRRFPSGLDGFEEVGNVIAQMTWSLGGGTTTYLYKRRQPVQAE